MSEIEKKSNYTQMTTEPVEKLVLKFAIPAIITMLITSIYNMVDTMFVGRISTEATAAVGIVFTYQAIVQAAAFFFAQGSANYISRVIGAKEDDKAKDIAAIGFFSAVLVGIFLMLLSLSFTDPILRLFGSTETILPDARVYLRVIALGTPFCMATFVLNVQMRLQGNAKYGMIGMTTGAILNMLFDPIFIFVLNLGVGGAALSTIFTQFISFVILWSLSSKNGGIKISIKNFKPTIQSYIEIAGGGLPSLLRQGLASIAGVCMFQFAGSYGDSVIAALSIINKVSMIVLSMVSGLGQGFQPVSGFNYGAKLYKRVENAFWFSVKIATVFCIFMTIGICIYSNEIISFFRAEDPELVSVGIRGLRYRAIMFPLLGYTIIVQMYLQNIRKVVGASILSTARQGIFYIPILFLLANTIGLEGVLLTQPLADLFSFALSIYIGQRALKDMNKLSSIN